MHVTSQALRGGCCVYRKFVQHSPNPAYQDLATIKQPTAPERDPRVRAVFDDIRATRQTDFINNLWRPLALDPTLLEETWSEIQRLMATPACLDPVTKEMNYIAVSIANSCRYCVHSHTVVARGKGMTDAPHAELLFPSRGQIHFLCRHLAAAQKLKNGSAPSGKGEPWAAECFVDYLRSRGGVTNDALACQCRPNKS